MNPALYGFIAGGVFSGGFALAVYAICATVMDGAPAIRRALAGVPHQPKGRGA